MPLDDRSVALHLELNIVSVSFTLIHTTTLQPVSVHDPVVAVSSTSSDGQHLPTIHACALPCPAQPPCLSTVTRLTPLPVTCPSHRIDDRPQNRYQQHARRVICRQAGPRRTHARDLTPTRAA